MTTRKSLNREIYEGADMIALRLRAAKKPAVIPFLEIPPEEIDLEPVTIEPVDLTDAEPMPIMPLVVPVSEILPFDEDEDDATSSVSETSTAEMPPSSNRDTDGKTAAPRPAAPTGEGLSLFGVGTIIDKPTRKPRSH